MRWAFLIIVCIVQVVLAKSQSIEIVASEYGLPELSALITITDADGQATAPSANSILIRQYNEIIEPVRVYQVGNNYRVEWIPDIELGTQADFIFDYEYEMFYSGFDSIVTATDEIPDIRLPRLSLEAVGGGQIDEIQMPNTDETFTSSRQFYLSLNKGVWDPDEGVYKGIRLDSISYDDEVFRVFPSIVLPEDLGQSSDYLFNVRFSPPAFQYYITTVTLYFNGGYKLNFDLFGNPPIINRNYDLELLSPTDEQVLAPCTEHLINWTGNTKDIRSILEISYDGGLSYSFLTSTLDTSYLWTVPDTLTEFVRIRVRQEALTEEYNRTMEGLQLEPDKVAFAPDARYGAIAGTAQEMYTYDAVQDKLQTIFHPSAVPGMANTDLAFADNNVAVLSYFRVRFGERRDTMAVFNMDNRLFVTSVKSPVSIKGLRSYKDGLLLISPEISNTVYSFDYKTLEFKKELKIDYPISDVSYSEILDQIVVVDFSGNVQSFDANTKAEVKSFSIQNFPQPGLAIISPDGQYVAVSKYYLSGTMQNIQIYDVNLGKRVRKVPNGWASATRGLEFSPTSRHLLMAHAFNPKLVISDITNGLTQSISTEGGGGEVLDFSYSTNENQFLVLQPDNLSRFVLSYPQYDQNDQYVKIRKPEIQVENIVLTSTLVADSSYVSVAGNLCNQSEAPFPIKEIWLASGEHMRLLSPSEGFLDAKTCTNIEIVFNPKARVGQITDTIFIASCLDTIAVPVGGESLARNIEMVSNPYDFGEKCIGEEFIITDEFFTNLDTADVIIDRIQFLGDAFRARFAEDTMVAPGGKWGGEVSLTPLARGKQTDTLAIYNSGMKDGPPLYYPFTYFGLGSEIEQGHTYLSFTPEQLVRESYIVNTEPTPIIINDLKPALGLNYSIDVDLPVTLNQGDRLDFIITSTDPLKYDTLRVDAEPCINFERMILGPYKADTRIIAYDVEVKPTEYATLVFAQETNTENYFKGQLKLDLEVKVDAESFLPLDYESDFEIVNIEESIIGTDRVMHIYLKGDFREFDTILKITGPAALTEKTETNITITRNLGLFTSLVPTAIENGKLRIINDSPGRLIFSEGQNITLNAYPNPANTEINLELVFDKRVETDFPLEILLHVYEPSGRAIDIRRVRPSVFGSKATMKLPVTDLRNGEYFLELRIENSPIGGIKFIKE